MSLRAVTGSTNRGRGAAWGAFVVGMGYAAVSFYWGVGGTGLLDTVGGDLATEGRAGAPPVFVAVWLTFILKVVASVLPLVAVGVWGSGEVRSVARWFSWAEAIGLSASGALISGVGLLVLAEVIPADQDADLHALAWQTYFWDPWFLLWGVLVFVALRRSR